MSEDDHKDYDVGYGKPPEGTRFKKGKSGNPKGRPKKEHFLKDVVEKVVRQKITVHGNAGPRKISKMNALVEKVVNDALKGDARATRNALSLMSIIGEGSDMNKDAEQAFARLVEEDKDILARLGQLET